MNNKILIVSYFFWALPRKKIGVGLFITIFFGSSEKDDPKKDFHCDSYRKTSLSLQIRFINSKLTSQN